MHSPHPFEWWFQYNEKSLCCLIWKVVNEGIQSYCQRVMVIQRWENHPQTSGQWSSCQSQGIQVRHMGHIHFGPILLTGGLSWQVCSTIFQLVWAHIVCSSFCIHGLENLHWCSQVVVPCRCPHQLAHVDMGSWCLCDILLPCRHMCMRGICEMTWDAMLVIQFWWSSHHILAGDREAESCLHFYIGLIAESPYWVMGSYTMFQSQWSFHLVICHFCKCWNCMCFLDVGWVLIIRNLCQMIVVHGVDCCAILFFLWIVNVVCDYFWFKDFNEEGVDVSWSQFLTTTKSWSWILSDIFFECQVEVSELISHPKYPRNKFVLFPAYLSEKFFPHRLRVLLSCKAVVCCCLSFLSCFSLIWA